MPKRYSTKNLLVSTEATPEKTGIATFEFTDDYSVFHYSKMPDQIPGKGEALCRMAVTTLRKIAASGIPTHFLDFAPPNRMGIRLVRVIDGATCPLTPSHRSRLVPLQVICRNMLPAGASVFRRLKARSVTLEELELTAMPAPGQRLARPLIEFTTKLEEIDRHITPEEARCIAGLDDAQFARVKELTLAINEIVTSHAASVGLVHADSKVEFGIDGDGRVILVDTAGTPDENRFVRDGYHVTKQILRDHYLEHGLEQDVERWVAEGRPRSTWPKPERLPPELISAVSDMYKAIANLWTGEKRFEVEPLDSVIADIKRIQKGRSVALPDIAEVSP